MLATDRDWTASELVIYLDAGHGGIFQHHREFVATALQFLEANGRVA